MHELAAALTQNRLSCPTSVMMNEKMELLHVQPGYLTEEQLLPMLQYLGQDIYETTSWEDYQASLGDSE